MNAIDARIGSEREPFDLALFFETLLPSVVTTGYDGRLGIELVTEDGFRRWILDLRTGSVEAGHGKPVDGIFRARADTFTEFLQGIDNAASAFSSGEFAYEGDLALLEILNARLERI